MIAPYLENSHSILYPIYTLSFGPKEMFFRGIVTEQLKIEQQVDHAAGNVETSIMQMHFLQKEGASNLNPGSFG